MRKEFYNAKECAKYFAENHDHRMFPKELKEVYNNSPISYLHNEMWCKYVSGKPYGADQCEEYQNAKQNTIDFIEQKLLLCGYDLSIIYTVECDDFCGHFAHYTSKLENAPQQLKLFN